MAKVANTTKVVVHSFYLGDVEDPQLFAGEGLYNWEHSEAGQWVMQNSIEPPSWLIVADSVTYGHVCKVRAAFDDKTYTYWKLKYE